MLLFVAVLFKLSPKCFHKFRGFCKLIVEGVFMISSVACVAWLITRISSARLFGLGLLCIFTARLMLFARFLFRRGI